ncbi:uncharacterized protein UBRO_20919 [Ustilago bromivora]|uniref:Uncharacterized protein n=1 Tax=Ustilago bromivora TaxID=307758 RepID=A0A1K0GBT7_9BASI|nr:uncharacterized protein UBRO_20919 [Ustilago bromivora]
MSESSSPSQLHALLNTHHSRRSTATSLSVTIEQTSRTSLWLSATALSSLVSGCGVSSCSPSLLCWPPSPLSEPPASLVTRCLPLGLSHFPFPSSLVAFDLHHDLTCPSSSLSLHRTIFPSPPSRPLLISSLRRPLSWTTTLDRRIDRLSRH